MKKLLSLLPVIGWILYLFVFKTIHPLFKEEDKYKDEKDLCFFFWHCYCLFFVFFIL